MARAEYVVMKLVAIPEISVTYHSDASPIHARCGAKDGAQDVPEGNIRKRTDGVFIIIIVSLLDGTLDVCLGFDARDV